ncbi:MAG: hypothetical protein GY926_11145 [bacterium]|nr:hypothetical protein [bacterium]
MARRRSRRRKSSYSESDEQTSSDIAADELSPRARRLVESGVIDLETISGSGPDGSVTSGDILHAARVMEMEQSVPRIERTSQAVSGHGESDDPAADDDLEAAAPAESGSLVDVPELVTPSADSGTSTTAQVGGEPITVALDPWDDYNGSSEGLSEGALPGAEQSWGEAEANIAAIADEAAANDGESDDADADESAEETAYVDADRPEQPAAVTSDEAVDGEPVEIVAEPPVEPEPAAVDGTPLIDSVPEAGEGGADEASDRSIADLVAAANEAIATTSTPEIPSPEVSIPEGGTTRHESDVASPVVAESQGEVMMDFGTLELVDPDSVWAEGVEDFAPWFLAHSEQLGDVLGFDAGLSDARQFTTKSATGVLGRDDGGEDVVVVSSKNATADDSDLGRALGMAASSGAGSVALVSAALNEDQLKALAWLNNQTRSGVKWYGIEMQVVRIADSPAAMMFKLVASPPQD